MCYLRRVREICLAVLVLSMVAVAAAVEGEAVPEDAGYRVGPGDVLKVEAYSHDEISGQFAVEESGEISFPILGRVPVAGSTTSEIARRLEELLERDYYHDVQLQVEIQEYRSQPVTVLGEVARPGTYYLEGRTSLQRILAEAGGLTGSAGPVVELRRLVAVDGDEQPVVRVFSTARLVTGEEGRDAVLQPGDVVSVSTRQRYFITGEIASPGQYDLMSDMTLMQALSQAGGLGKFASQTVEVHRGGDGDKVIQTFDLSQIRKGKQPDPVVEAGDVIIVRRRFF
jgi:polysaccharide export outer membrane protein